MAQSLQKNEIDKLFIAIPNQDIRQRQRFIAALYLDLFGYLKSKLLYKYHPLNEQEIEDGIQDVFVRVFTENRVSKIRFSLMKYLTRACKSELARLAEKKREQAPTLFSTLPTPVEALTPSLDELLETQFNPAIIHADNLEEVYASLNSVTLEICDIYSELSKLYQPREKFLLRYLFRTEGWKKDTIASKAGLTESTVTSYLKKVNDELKELTPTIYNQLYNKSLRNKKRKKQNKPKQ